MNKKNLLKKFLLPLICALFAYFLAGQDSFLYHAPIGEITSVQTIQTQPTLDDFQNRDQQITQQIELKLLNQNHQKISLENTTTKSQTTGQLYHVGQQVILKKLGNQLQISTLKRDALIVSLLTLLIGLLISFQRLRASIFLLVSLLLNLVYFTVAIFLNIQFNPPVLVLFGFLSVLFAGSSLLFVLGRTRQMLYTFITTILTTFLTFLLVFFVLHLTGNAGVHFEYLNYVTQDPSEFFFVGTMISVLGAIMDGTGDIVAGLFGLARQNQLNQINMKRADYFKSGLNIGREIIGTLTNVLFMIFMAEALPMTLLLLRNGNSWSYIATVGLNLGLLQSVISAIGIVLAVPVTAGLTSFGLVLTPNNFPENSKKAARKEGQA